jgi:hypothetical protein
MTTAAKELPAPPQVRAVVVAQGAYEVEISDRCMTVYGIGSRGGRTKLFSANHKDAECILGLVEYGKRTIETMTV